MRYDQNYSNVDSRGSPERFGYSWERFSEPTADQEEQFRRWTVHLNPGRDWKGVRVLDAGCGAGRNSYWALKYGAASCVCVDLDERSLSAAKRNLSAFPDAKIQKCSIYDLAFENEFDVVFSIGVIHHLAKPQDAVKKLSQAAKPGGRVLLWVYGCEGIGTYVHLLNPLRKALFSWMPLPLVRTLAYIPAALLWLILRAGLTPLEYLRLLRKFSFAHLHHIVFDQMLPKIAHYWTKSEAVALLEQAGLVDIKAAWVNQVSWSVIGVKPPRL
jgi:SAM-dependent methyltransferase